MEGGGARRVLNSKKDAAVRFIQEIQRMDPRQLHALIARDPERALQNGSSLMLMGYLIRTKEELRAPFPLHPTALA